MQFVKKRDCFCPRMRDAGEECVLRTRESLEAGPQDYEEAAPSRFDLFLEGCCGETRGRGHIHLSAGEEQARAVCMPIGGGELPPSQMHIKYIRYHLKKNGTPPFSLTTIPNLRRTDYA